MGTRLPGFGCEAARGLTMCNSRFLADRARRCAAFVDCPLHQIGEAASRLCSGLHRSACLPASDAFWRRR
jgi:hypothetical protein